MNVFAIFSVIVDFLNGLAMLFTGLFLWRNFRDDYEARTIGGVFALASLIFFVMGLRVLFWNLEWIGEGLGSDIFFIEYIIIFFLLLAFALPRFFSLAVNRPIVKKISPALGSILYLIYLVIHFNQKEKIIAHYAPYGLIFELPYLEKLFLLIIFILLLPVMVKRVIVHFFRWRKTRVFPYRFLNYLLMFFILAVSIFYILPRFKPWQSLLGAVLSLSGILGIYLVSSQEIMRREE